jgi:hypothetical protein
MPKLKILFVSANSVPDAPLKVEEEYKEVCAKVRPSKGWDIRHTPAATLKEVRDEIKHYCPDIVHFSAHGSPSEEIVLNDKAGKPKPVPTRALKQLFETMKGNVRLVIMNSCYSARQARAIGEIIDCVFGVKLQLVDDTAIVFSEGFYEALVEGKSVAVAYETALILVYGERPENEQVPRLFKGRIRPEQITFLRAQPKTSPPPARPALRDKVEKTKKKVNIRASEESATSTPLGRTVSGHSCQSLRWDVKIDEEGDAYNEMTYKGIVLPPEQPYVFELPPAEVQSGHTTEFELIWDDDRTTEGSSLKHGNVSPTKIEMHVGFVNRPTSSNPARFAVRCWDWNVYSMNMEEYRQKPRWSEDGLDYAEKHIPGQWQSFTLLIQFPQQIVFARRPFFEVYNRSSSTDEVRNDELTASCQHCFDYSSALNQAVLFVEHPPSPFSYRISWRLGESRVSVASALSAVQRLRQRTFARRLLLMRRAVEADEGDKMTEAKQLEQGVNSVLASVAEHVQIMLGGAQLDPANLEISMMVLDEDQPEQPPMDIRKFPVLRIVAGTLLRDTGYRALAFFVGDGNAGRAWKRRMARVFDLNEKDPKRHVYVPIPGSPRHCFLVSIPLIDPDSDALIYGILNIGAFTDEQAELLRRIGTAQEVQSITSYAQSYVLKRLMELVKL